MELACLDGEVVALVDARIPVTDEGLLRGDGVFEVMRLYGGVPLARAAHLERMAHSAANLRLELDVDAFARDIESLLAATQPQDCLLRAVATRGERRIVLLEQLPALPESLALGCVTYAPVRVLDGVKSLSYAANMLAGRLARERGFDDALLVSPHGRVLELPMAAFFWAAGGRLYTPPLDEHILDSITRRIVIEVAGAIETPATVADVTAADEAFAASSVVEVLPVRQVEQRTLPVGAPLTTQTAGAVRARIAELLALP
jgi:branched-chain amino acid aminotransferase